MSQAGDAASARRVKSRSEGFNDRASEVPAPDRDRSRGVAGARLPRAEIGRTKALLRDGRRYRSHTWRGSLVIPGAHPVRANRGLRCERNALLERTHRTTSIVSR